MSQASQELRKKIFDELTKIVDPEINVSIMELELVDNVDIEDSKAKVDLHLTSPFCPAVFGFKIAQDIHDNLLSLDELNDVKVNVSDHFMAEQINNQVNSSPNPKNKGQAGENNQSGSVEGSQEQSSSEITADEISKAADQQKEQQQI